MDAMVELERVWSEVPVLEFRDAAVRSSSARDSNPTSHAKKISVREAFSYTSAIVGPPKPPSLSSIPVPTYTPLFSSVLNSACRLFLDFCIHRFPYSFPAMFGAARNSVLRQARTQLRLTKPTYVSHSALARLLSTLAILEQREGKLNISSLAAVTAAQKLGGPVHGFVVGSGVKAVAEEAAKVEGLEKIIYVENGAYDKVSSFPYQSGAAIEL